MAKAGETSREKRHFLPGNWLFCHPCLLKKTRRMRGVGLPGSSQATHPCACAALCWPPGKLAGQVGWVSLRLHLLAWAAPKAMLRSPPPPGNNLKAQASPPAKVVGNAAKGQCSSSEPLVGLTPCDQSWPCPACRFSGTPLLQRASQTKKAGGECRRGGAPWPAVPHLGQAHPLSSCSL